MSTKVTRIAIRKFLSDSGIDPSLPSVSLTEALYKLWLERATVRETMTLVRASYEDREDAVKIHGILYSHVEFRGGKT